MQRHTTIFCFILFCFMHLSAEARKINTHHKADSTKVSVSKDDLVGRYSQKFQINDSCLKVPSLYVNVDKWVGTPYRYGKMSLSGTDCSGFVSQIFKDYTDAVLPRSARGMAEVIDQKPVEELKEGDLVFFNYYGKINSHVGIYLQNGWFVHASSKNGVTLNNLFSAYYQKRFSKGGSLKIGSLLQLIDQLN